VEVNGEPADRQGTYYSAVVEALNASAAVYTQVVVTATDGDENMTAVTGRVFVTQTPESFIRSLIRIIGLLLDYCASSF
jgi:hypothetical protein